MINAKEILQRQLAQSLGLDRYAEIVRGDSSSPEFQKTFNGYYRIRRNEEWRLNYYKLFNKARREYLTFDQIITELYDLTGNIEASFSSKMLATIDDSKPIWDQYVLHNLGLKLKGNKKEKRLQNAIALYSQIEEWYATYLITTEAKDNIEEFNQMLPDYVWISDVKKIDCLLWSKRT